MIVELAPAKLNLALHVRARRPDGYHELETLFAFVEHGDMVRIVPAPVDTFRISGPFAPKLDANDDNLVTRAREAFRSVFGGGPCSIELEKNLPVASGIGGGSADAAATLRGLARLVNISPDDPRLFGIADRLGSDVPACLLGRTAIGRGRGERLEPVPGLRGTNVLLVNPGIAVATAEVFRRWDQVDRGAMPEDPRAGRNDLYSPALEVAPVLGEVMAWLEGRPGSTLARMSGSGATCFALFDSTEAASAAASAVPNGWWHLQTRLTG